MSRRSALRSFSSHRPRSNKGAIRKRLAHDTSGQRKDEPLPRGYVSNGSGRCGRIVTSFSVASERYHGKVTPNPAETQTEGSGSVTLPSPTQSPPRLTTLPEAERPTVKLIGEDGNAFAILGRVRRALRRADYSEEQVEEFTEEATSSDYTHLLATVTLWVNEE